MGFSPIFSMGVAARGVAPLRRLPICMHHEFDGTLNFDKQGSRVHEPRLRLADRFLQHVASCSHVSTVSELCQAGGLLLFHAVSLGPELPDMKRTLPDHP